MKTLTLCASMRFYQEMQAIVDAHKKKIDLSDAIYVVDIDGYIGQSVKQEISYAKQQGKEIIFHSQFSNTDTTSDKQEA